MKQDEELLAGEDSLGKMWPAARQPWTQTIVNLWLDFLPKQTYPKRSGVHTHTAFGLAFSMDGAEKYSI